MSGKWSIQTPIWFKVTLFATEISRSPQHMNGGEEGNGRKRAISRAKQTRRRPIKIQLLPLNSPLLEMQIIRDHLIVPDTGRAKLSPASQRQPSNTLCPYPSGHPHTASLLCHLPQASHPDPQSLEKTPGQRWTRGSWMGPGLAFVRPHCRVPLFTQSLTLYVFLSLNCIGLCCPLVNQYHLSTDISNSIQQSLSRWWVFRGRAGGNEPG